MSDKNVSQQSLRSKTGYPEEFDAIWWCFGATEKAGLGKRGSKQEAYNAWLKNHDDLDTMKNALRAQAIQKLSDQRRGEFAEPFKHACRWFKYRGWEDGPDEVDNDFLLGADKEAADLQLNEKLTNYADRGWAE